MKTHSTSYGQSRATVLSKTVTANVISPLAGMEAVNGVFIAGIEFTG